MGSRFFIVLFLGYALEGYGDFYCKYSCDTNKARKYALAFLETGKLPDYGCFNSCTSAELLPFFCEFFSNLLYHAKTPNHPRLKELSQVLLAMPHDKDLPLSSHNNFSYHILNDVTVGICRKRINIVSSSVPETHQHQTLDKLQGFLNLLKKGLEKKYPSFKRYQRIKKGAVEKLPAIEQCQEDPKKSPKLFRLFNWCYNYCNGDRAPKTFVGLKRLVKHSKGRNPGEIIEELKKGPPPFQKHHHKYARRAYKCLSQCTVQSMEDYICYLLDEIDITDDQTYDDQKKILDILGQILLMSFHEDGDESYAQSKLSYYLKHPQYTARCNHIFKDFYYRGMNYRINMEYLRKAYLTS